MTMKNIISILVVFIFIISFSKCKLNDQSSDDTISVFLENNDFPVLTGPYMGQDPPGMTPEIFDPGVFPENESLGCSGFLNNGTVFVFSCMRPGSNWRIKPTYVTELIGERWTKPHLASFSKYFPYNFTVAPDDQTVYFTSLISPEKNSRELLESANIWFVALQNDTWTEPVMFGKSINTENFSENYPSVTENGTIYYMSRRDNGVGKTDIYRSEDLGNRFNQAENLGNIINTTESDQDPFIAPDESYLIVCLDKEDGYGKYDLYISFRKEDGSWTVPVNMGKKVNSAKYEFRPYVTPDGKYMFFTSDRLYSGTGNIFWMDAKIIENLKDD